MEGNFTDLISDSKLISMDLNIFEANSSNIGNERAAEIVEQQLFSLVDQCFWEIPLINAERITKAISEMNKFLSINNISQDNKLTEYINRHLFKAVQEYN